MIAAVRTLIFAAVCTVGASVSLAQTSAAEEAPVAEVTNAVVENDMVCKRIAEAGTRIKKRICHTRATWDAIEEQAQREMNLMKDRNVASPGQAG